MSLLEGRAKKFDGSAIDYVSIFNWSDGKCIAQVNPDTSGNWYYYYHADSQVGITYVADGCEPITHGAYTVERNNDLNPDWMVINSPFSFDTDDLTGKTWAVHGNAAVSNASLRLDGNGDYLDMPYSPSIDFSASQDVTIRFKATVDSFSNGRKILLTTRIDLPTHQGGISNWSIYTSPNGIFFIIWSGSGNPDIVSKQWESVYSFGSEFELSLERKNMVWRLYANGSQLGASVTQASNHNHARDALLTVGSEFNAGGGATRDLKGSIRNLQILKGTALGGGGSTTPLMS